MLFDLPSRDDFNAIQSKLDAVLAVLARVPDAVDAELMTIQDVVAYTNFNRKTVEKWVEDGEFHESTDQKIYLPARKYSGRLRFKRADVDAFGLGIGVLACSLAGTPEAVKQPKRGSRKMPVSSERALRKAA